MKKLIILLLLIVIPYSLFATFTDEEFYEVYNQLQVTTEKLEAQQKEIEELSNLVETLTTANSKLIYQIEASNSTLQNVRELFDNAREDLEKSNKKLNDYSKGGFILGLNTGIGTKNLPNSIYLGLNAGWRFNKSALICGVSTSKMNTLINLSYNFLF